MSAISDCIPCDSPKSASVQVARDDMAGRVVLIIRVGGVPASVSLDAAGWRALSHALGIPPASEFVPAERTCRCCGRDRRTVKNWAAANLCEACVGKPIRAGVKGPR